jgi:hypothetical protein
VARPVLAHRPGLEIPNEQVKPRLGITRITAVDSITIELFEADGRPATSGKRRGCSTVGHPAI